MHEEGAADADPFDLAMARASQKEAFNLNGQRLGRNGRETRERIVRAGVAARTVGRQERAKGSYCSSPSSTRLDNNSEVLDLGWS